MQQEFVLNQQQNDLKGFALQPIKRTEERKEGWLVKKSGILGNEKSYWFETDDLTEYVSYYVRPPAEGALKSQLKGTFSLKGCTIERFHTDKKFGIKIKTAIGKKMELLMPSANERDAWEKAFTKARDISSASETLVEDFSQQDDLKDFGIFVTNSWLLF
jgi:hypothetical protein